MVIMLVLEKVEALSGKKDERRLFLENMGFFRVNLSISATVNGNRWWSMAV